MPEIVTRFIDNYITGVLTGLIDRGEGFTTSFTLVSSPADALRASGKRWAKRTAKTASAWCSMRRFAMLTALERQRKKNLTAVDQDAGLASQDLCAGKDGRVDSRTGCEARRSLNGQRDRHAGAHRYRPGDGLAAHQDCPWPRCCDDRRDRRHGVGDDQCRIIARVCVRQLIGECSAGCDSARTD